MRILPTPAVVVISLVLAMTVTPEARGSGGASSAAAQEVARVAESRGVRVALAWFASHSDEISAQQIEATSIPAPPFGEAPRGRWLQQRFLDLGLEVHEQGGNVFAIRRGQAPGEKYIALTAHLDTVFPPGTPLHVHREGDRIYGPGIADNGAGLAALLAIAGALNAAHIRTAAPLLFIGNVGEEGEGDLRGMRAIFSSPRWKDAIGCTIVVDGAGNDTLVSEALGSRRFQVTVRGPGGHSWSDYGTANPIIVLARAIDAFGRVPVPDEPKTSTNVGVISGGTSVNAIPESATMKVDIRSAMTSEIDRLEQALRQSLENAVGSQREQANAQGGLTYEIKQIGSRPAAELDPQAPILQVLRAVDGQLGITTRLQRASTDANIPLSLGMQAVAVGAGGTGGGAHTVHEWYDRRTRELGLQRILLSVLALAGEKP